MKRSVSLIFAVIISASSTFAQLQRSDAFHEKYKLSEAVIFSRHNIRAPLATPGSFVSQVTPYQWYDFGVGRSELTMKGGILETTNGQFFHQWVVSEGLFPENAEPTDDELYVLANSKQRTISTARHFAASFMPMKTVTVHHDGNIGDMDATFSLNLNSDITEAQWQQIKAEYDSAYSDQKIQQFCQSLKPTFDLLEDVLDVKNSEIYKAGTFTGFNNYNSTISYGVGTEPAMTASLNDAGDVVDALVLQYYQEPDLQKVAFGKTLTNEQWHDLAAIIHHRDAIRFSSPFVQRYVSKNLRHLIAAELQKEGRKFTFICGHDTNILNILSALKVKSYETTDAIESGTPIGSKIVFEKWTDTAGNEYVGVNHVYQTVDQLRNNTLLNAATPPVIIPLSFDGLDPNADGLFPLSDIVSWLTGCDNPTDISNVKQDATTGNVKEYTAEGIPSSKGYHGVKIQNGKKHI